MSEQDNTQPLNDMCGRVDGDVAAPAELTTHDLAVPDITSAGFKANPAPMCAYMRTNEPVVCVPVPAGLHEAYLVTRYADADAVLSDERFVKDIRHARDPHDLQVPWMFRALVQHLIDTNANEHGLRH